MELGNLSSLELIYSCSLLRDSQTRTIERPCEKIEERHNICT